MKSKFSISLFFVLALLASNISQRLLPSLKISLTHSITLSETDPSDSEAKVFPELPLAGFAPMLMVKLSATFFTLRKNFFQKNIFLADSTLNSLYRAHSPPLLC